MIVRFVLRKIVQKILCFTNVALLCEEKIFIVISLTYQKIGVQNFIEGTVLKEII